MAAERAVSLRASADPICTELGRKGEATFAHLGRQGLLSRERGNTAKATPPFSTCTISDGFGFWNSKEGMMF